MMEEKKSLDLRQYVFDSSLPRCAFAEHYPQTKLNWNYFRLFKRIFLYTLLASLVPAAAAHPERGHRGLKSPEHSWLRATEVQGYQHIPPIQKHSQADGSLAIFHKCE